MEGAGRATLPVTVVESYREDREFRMRIHGKVASACLPLVWWPQYPSDEARVRAVSWAAWFDKERLHGLPAETVSLIADAFMTLDAALNGRRVVEMRRQDALVAISGMYHLFTDTTAQGIEARELLSQLCGKLRLGALLSEECLHDQTTVVSLRRAASLGVEDRSR